MALSREEKEKMVLYYNKGYTYKQLTKELRMSPNQIREIIKGHEEKSDARVYIKEYSQYGTNPPDSSIDLNDAFYNDAPYTGVWKDEIVIPLGVIEKREESHACIEDTDKGITLACYKLENTEEQGPEKLTIDFNNFP